MTRRFRRAQSCSLTTALIVEDKPSSSSYLCSLVAGLGFDSVWRVRSVRQALRYCSVTPFDVAIVQLQLGAEDGGHLITALRAWPGSVDFIVAVSIEQERLREAAKARLPADAFLQLPLNSSTLKQVIGHRVRPSSVNLSDHEDTLILND